MATAKTNNVIKLEKNVPLKPVKASNYPLDVMQVGDSFVVPCLGVAPVKVQNSTWMAIRYWNVSKNKGYKFKTATTEDKKGVRVWRIA